MSLHDEGLFTVIEDDRNWGTYLGISFNHHEPITPWVWKSGEEKDLDFRLVLNREFTATPAQAEAPSQDPSGHWYGSCDFLGFAYRAAFCVHQGSDGKYQIINDEVDGETSADVIQGVTWEKPVLTIKIASPVEGPVIEKLSLDPTGSTLTGTIVVGGENPFMAKGKPYPLKFSRGLNFSVPRVDGEGKAVTQYTYQLPQTLTDGWPVGDLGKSSMDPVIVEKGINQILNQKFPRVQSLLLVQHGRLLLDEYFQGFGPGDIHQIQSSSKSVFSILFGIAHDQGLVDPEQKLYDFYPEYRGKQTVGSRIRIGSPWGPFYPCASGFACDDWVPATDCHKEMWKTTDWLDFVLNQPMNHKPGEFWAYCNDCLEPLGDILARKSGMSVPDFAQKYLFGPLGFQDPYWIHYSPNGITDIAGSILLRPRDMAKVGELVLQKGKWNDRRIVSEKWLQESTQFQSPITKDEWYDGYGYLWWRKQMLLKSGKTQAVFSAGKGGQFIFTVPDLDLVCVMTGGNYDDYRAETMEVGFFQAYILGAIK